VSNNKPFVKSNLLRYKSTNTNSIPKQYVSKGNVSSKATLGNGSFCAGNKSFPPYTTLRPQPRPPTPGSQYLSQNKTIQWLVPPSSLPSATISYGYCRVRMHSESKESYSLASVGFHQTCLREAHLLTYFESLGVTVCVALFY